MRVLVVGYGSIGRRHLRNLMAIRPEASFCLLRRPSSRSETVDAPGAVVVHGLDEAIALAPDAAVIASPATQHVETALALAERGVHLFIEKPLAEAPGPALDALLTTAAARRLTLMVGYNFRFFRPLQRMREALESGMIGTVVGWRAEVGQYLPDWRPGTDYRASVSAQRALGGGALLELSHELDLVRWLGGEIATVSAQLGRHGGLAIDVEDTADLLLRTQAGPVASVHLDLLQRSTTRLFRAIGREGTLECDLVTGALRAYRADRGAWEAICEGGVTDRNEMYLEEMRHFLASVASGVPPVVSGEDGVRALRVIEAARQSAEEQRVIAL